MAVFDYEIVTEPDAAPISGLIEADDQIVARKELIEQFGINEHGEISLRQKTASREKESGHRALTTRYVLQSLINHHMWLEDVQEGERAELKNMNLSGLALPRKLLDLVSFSGSKLRQADLQGCSLQNVDFSGADLYGADLSYSNLANADLSDTDLRGANLTGANLKGVDVWRANLRGCIISPEELHTLIGCSHPKQ